MSLAADLLSTAAKVAAAIDLPAAGRALARVADAIWSGQMSRQSLALLVLLGVGPYGSSGGGGGEALLETVTLSNFSGASRTDPYVTFRRSFAAGDVPSGSIVEVRYNSAAVSVQQADARTLHSDGSLAHATFSFKPSTGAVSDNGTFTVDLYKKSGSWDNTAGPALSTLTAQNYRLKCAISAVDYYCVLNNLINAGTYRTIRSGACVLAIEAWGIFRQGTAASDTDHGQLQGKFFAYIWSDNTITVFAEAVNGRVANGQAYTVTDLVLQNGVTDLINLGGFTWYHHTRQSLVGAAGLPVWSANATDIWASVDAAYLHAKKLLWNIHSSSTQRAAIGSGTALNYAANYDFLAGGSINGGGASAWIGIVPDWTAFALLTNNKTRIRNDRVNGLAQGTLSPGWYRRTESGLPPVLVNQDYTASGLTAAQTSIGWSSEPTITNTGGDPPGSALDFSHGPEYAYFQWITTGWEWWLDAMLAQIVAACGAISPGTDDYKRNAIINSTNYYGVTANYSQARHIAWARRTAGNLMFTRPDSWPAAAYADKLQQTNIDYAEAYLTAPHFPTAYDALTIWTTGDGRAEGLSLAPWQHFYLGLSILMEYRRGQISVSARALDHFRGWSLGALNACLYHALGADRIAIRIATPPGGTVDSNDPFTESWNDVWYGGDGASLLTKKLISDSGGTSGSCPASGMDPGDEQYTAGHNRPSIAHAAVSIANGLNISGASTVISGIEAVETAAALSETAWNNGPQWRIRWAA